MKNCNCCTTYSAPDLMDGGVTAALIEKEVAGSYTRTDEGADLRFAAEQIAEAQAEATAAVTAKEKAEKERDEARKKVAEYVSLLAAPPARPLTADDITDEARKRAVDAWWTWKANGAASISGLVDAMLTAALAEPTPEPTDAERLADVLRRFPGRLAGIRDIADHLASEGVRVTGAES